MFQPAEEDSRTFRMFTAPLIGQGSCLGKKIPRESGRTLSSCTINCDFLTLGNCTVVTKDSDFRAVPGLTVEDWSPQ